MTEHLTTADVGAFVDSILPSPPATEEKRCPQCWRLKPLDAFVGARGGIVRLCTVCRVRYSGWERLSPEQRIARLAPREWPDSGETRVTWVPKTGNAKLGPIPVSITERASCPPACSWKGRGCYAEFGKLGHHWKRAAADGISWADFCGRVAALPEGTLWRHNEAGDLPGRGEAIDGRKFARLLDANEGRQGFTFTHRRVIGSDDVARRNREWVARANARGFVVNLSADSIGEADRLAELAIGPVAVVLPEDAPDKGTVTPTGRRVVVCLAQTQGITCLDCKLCAHPERVGIVGFRAHGQASALVTSLVRRTAP